MKEFKVNGVTFIFTPKNKEYYFMHKLSGMGALPKFLKTAFKPTNKDYKTIFEDYIFSSESRINILKETLKQYPE